MRLRWLRWRWMGPDERLGVRLSLAFVATFLLGLPFLIILLLVRDRWSPLLNLDLNVADELHEVALQRGWLVDTLKVISDVFDPFTFRIAATLIAGWLLWLRRYRLASWLLVTSWGAALLGIGLKALVGRTRPQFEEAVAHAGGKSFPSGHALGSMVGVGVLLLVLFPLVRQRWRNLALAVGVLVVVAVGFARVALGVHYFSDVVAGWVLGLAWLAVTAAAFEAWRVETGQPRTTVEEGLEPDLAEHLREPADRRG